MNISGLLIIWLKLESFLLSILYPIESPTAIIERVVSEEDTAIAKLLLLPEG